MIAKNTFVPNDPEDATDYEPDADFNYLGATVFSECDGNVTVQYPPVIGFGGDTVKTLNITAPNCRLDYLVPGTVIDIKDDGTLITSSGGFLQDDTVYMASIARSAYEWYRDSRRAMQVTVHDLGYQFSPDFFNFANPPVTIFLGTLVRNLGDQAHVFNRLAVNSVVTSVEYDMLAGTSTILTQFAELDL